MKTLLTIAYDGTQYAGWQRQKNAIAVQEKLEDALLQLFNEPIIVAAASRTDAGVHAMGQRAAFCLDDMRVPLDKLPQVLNGFLPQDISVVAAEEVHEGFNPRFDAICKTYSYSYYNANIPNPLHARYSAFVPQGLDIAAMSRAAKSFIGKHDFAAFMATGGSAKTTVREIFACDITAEPGTNIVKLTITGGGFLYNMVRIIAGTLMYVGHGKINADAIPGIIRSLDRTQAGKTMPPQGLTLLAVRY